MHAFLLSVLIFLTTLFSFTVRQQATIITCYSYTIVTAISCFELLFSLSESSSRLFFLSPYLSIRCSSLVPFCSNPPGLPMIPLGVSHSLCFSLSPSFPPSLLLSLPPSFSPSIYLSGLYSRSLVSSSLNKAAVFP